MKKEIRGKFRVLYFLGVSIILLFACQREEFEDKSSSRETPLPPNDHLSLGNPSNANTSDKDNYLMRKPQFVLSYSCSLNRAQWVAWHLNSAWLGTTDRQDNFRPDPDLPSGCLQVTTHMYTSSGFDRGHLCPSADRTATLEDNSATFLMTNIVPQAPQLNRGAWEQFESYCRSLARQGNELYIYAGVYGEGGTGSNGYRTKISNNRISVPSRFYKIVLVLSEGDNDIKRITANTRVIAIDMPNEQIESLKWHTYRVCVDQIEAATGFNFFSNLPVELQNSLESKVDNVTIM
ncbi:MAG: DNA/RNA non-specific endonuclease [Bacteroidia bacterium]|nr:DNA/RNA non-specific endonuclease [Bacteroidia bacterium]MDW8157325.1 DNA/RNA non-specific endonuclease [Bacteroidia bacterium]